MNSTTKSRKTIEVYLFDWGDTLMVDFPGMKGKMYQWGKVEAVAGAKQTLEQLSAHAHIFIATGAADSSPSDIQQAFERVGLARYISGYFCKQNVGFSKGHAMFLPTIIDTLKVSSDSVAMVGDNLEKDIKPAIAAGIQGFWFNVNKSIDTPSQAQVITQLSDLV
ncbi:HAD family hydrolase [Alteromonas sp. 5E99-2]|uniref:HAD family hydrolase n=1 Tax=Alteromonas sp. 5E99-2 TaxID=2817683 RepID=UPI001A997386|nr:HAD family hydrolase [Alteromonas sp. 5E99-2]MBO1255740.1 HAD family hydrolase [Alteromonas sp. 5E99-2]